MAEVCIALDNWKLSIFERHLQAIGYAFEQRPGLTADSMVLTVTTENVGLLFDVVTAAQAEAARTGAPQ